MADNPPHWIALERARSARRRQLLGGGVSATDAAGQVTPIEVGLALSGGGIRSATISLGTLQALAAKDAIKDIDYLSTVSGGGYAGGFLCSLYTPPSVRESKSAAAPSAAELQAAAHEALAQLAATERRVGKPAQGYAANALDWLRNSGRYLAPRGGSDYLFAAAMWLRNLLALHYVIGISLVGVLMCLIAGNGFAVDWLASACADFARNGCPPFSAAWFAPPVRSGVLYLLIAFGVALVGVLPLGIGFWFTDSSCELGPGWFAGLATWPSLLGLATPLALMAAGLAMPERLREAGANDFAWAAACVLLLSWIAYALWWSRAWFKARQTGGATINVTRTKLTQSLADAIRVLLALVAIGVVLIASSAVDSAMRESWWLAMSAMSGLAVAVAAFKPLLARLFHLERNRQQPSVGWVPVAIALVGLTVVVLFWGVAAMRLAGQGELVGWALVAVLALTVMAGRQFQFLNLSTIQSFYTARLVRAYLGASNAARFAVSNGSPSHSVTEPHPLDDMTLAQYYGPVGTEADQPLVSLAPQHIVNVTLNKTSGATDTLVVHDRKGLPLAVTPHGYLVDGNFWPHEEPAGATSGPFDPADASFERLLIGRWIGISGAAFAPGLGRASRLDQALVTVLLNLRLGYWWKVRLPGARFEAPRWWWPISTQIHLLREARGRFMGEDDSHWYLTDGGHFDNTGVYELLRRRVEVIVALENSADPEFRFNDIANLIRLASLDFGAVFKSIHPVELATAFAGTRHEKIAQLFASACDFASPEAAARAADLTRNGCGEGDHYLLAWRVELPPGPGFAHAKSVVVVFVKPRMTSDASLDLVQYHAGHPQFPHQPTSDQFFDDEQWESYRKLGFRQGAKLLDSACWSSEPFEGLVAALNGLRRVG